MNTTQGERDYLLIAIGCLLVISVILVDEALGWWALIPLLAGALGVFVPGSVAPAFVVFVVLVLLVLKPWFTGIKSEDFPEPGFTTILLFSMTLLGYVGSHVRLLAIQRHVIPPDPRRERKIQHERLRGRWLLPAEATRRSARLPTRELLSYLMSVPCFTIIAYLLWLRLTLEPRPFLFDASDAVWRVLILIWTGFLGLAGTYALTSYFKRSQSSTVESLCYLQDQLWAATRGEQRRMQSWYVWGKLKKERMEKD